MQLVGRSLFLFCVLLAAREARAEQKVAIRSDFSGGNVLVVKNEGAVVQLAPDLRGGQSWFYWHFEAAAAEPGKVTFAFAGSPIIGVRWPAYSLDHGKSWQFLGAEHCTYAALMTPAKDRFETFTFEFRPDLLKVRFAVAIPYLPENLKEFAAARAKNPNFKQEVLTKSRGGVPVEMFVIGTPGDGRDSMIVTARHHACESMASYVLEGFLDEAMSDSPAGSEFRKKYALFAIPLVDRDGVAAGDQGKNRDPHDHNRDYGPGAIYPEVKAIQELGEAQDIRYSIDFHCPALRGDIHEAFHFLGLGVPRVKENLDEYIAWIKEERPQLVMAPLNYLVDAAKPNAVNPKINSHHFALRKNAVFAATLEVPYTQVAPPLEIDMAREYGRGMLCAWVRTKFAATDAEAARGPEGSAALIALRSGFLKLYRSKPAEAEALAKAHLGAEANPVLRNEARNLMALLEIHQKKSPGDYRYVDDVIADPTATTYQRIVAALEYLMIAVDDSQSTRGHIEECLDRLLAIPYVAGEQQARGFEAAARWYEKEKRYPRAIELALRRVPVVASHETGKALNYVAALYDLDGKSQEAVQKRQEAVALLRERLGPAPKRNIFAAMMTLDLFDAVCAIPTSTLAEKQAAGKLALEHEIVAPMYKERVRKQLAELEKAAK